MSIPITFWAAEDIPSNKAYNLGVQALSNSELLSIIIGSGSSKGNAVETARYLLSKNDNSLQRLFKSSNDQLSLVEGIGKVKAAKIKAALELGSRLYSEKENNSSKVESATRLYNHLMPHFKGLANEEFWAVYCNNACSVISEKRLFSGGLTEVCVDVRIIIKEALLCNATCFFVAHNHPNGTIRPSMYDNNITEEIRKVSEIMRIRFLDHLIVGENNYYSYAENGKLVNY